MRFSAISSAVLAFAATALAQTDGFDVITAPQKDEVVPAGTTYTIVWSPNTKYNKTVTISLIGGASPALLQPVGDIATGIDTNAGTYAWAVDKTLGADARYGIKISLDSDPSIFQYSNPFKIAAASGSATTTGYAVSSYSATKTVSLSSYSAKATSVYTKSASSYTVVSSSSYPATTAAGNLSTTATAGATTLTSAVTVSGSASASKTTSSSVTVPTGAANRAAVGSVALFGGFAAALFAL